MDNSDSNSTAVVYLRQVGKIVCSDIEQARLNQLVRLLWPTEKMRESLRPKEKYHFQNISLEVKAGEKVYIGCASKSGKSLLAKLIARFVEPSSGSVGGWGRVQFFQSKLNLNRPLMSLAQYGWTVASLLKIPISQIRDVVDDALEACELTTQRNQRNHDIDQKKLRDFQNYIQLQCEADLFVFEDSLPLKWSSQLQKLFEQKTSILISSGWIPPKQFTFNRNFYLLPNQILPLSETSIIPLIVQHPDLIKVLVAEGEKEFFNQLQEQLAPKLQQGDKVGARKGSGLVRFSGLLLKDPITGKIIKHCHSGQPVCFDIYYEQPGPSIHLSTGHCVLLVETSPGQRILGSDMVSLGESFHDLPAKGKISMQLDRLPLLPGNYNLVVSITLNGGLADKVVDEWSLPVLFGDFYGNGKLPPPKWGEALLPYKWSYIPDAEKTSSDEFGFTIPSPRSHNTGPAFIHSIEFLDVDGTPVNQYRTGDPAKIRVYYQLRQPTAENNASGWVSMTFRSGSSSKPIFSAVMQAPDEEIVGLSARGAFEVNFESLPLFPQEYFVAVNFTLNGELSDKFPAGAPINVTASQYLPGPEKPSITWGHVFIKPTWTLTGHVFSQSDREAIDDDDENAIDGDSAHDL